MTYLLDRFVPGQPAPFATRGEGPWKDAIAAALAGMPPDGRGLFLELEFVVAPAVGYAEGADLDNLCEPVFSVVANRLLWFKGARPNVSAFRARKKLGRATGCHIRIAEHRWSETWLAGEAVLDAATDLPLPRNARDEPFIEWVASSMRRPAKSKAPIGVEIRFAGPINLGDIATGRLKNVIDCLQPILGGRIGATDDSRISVIEAARVDGTVTGTVAVRVTELRRPSIH